MNTAARPDGDTDAAGTALRGVLADSYVLMMKTQACHWNTRGYDFFALHTLTEAQYNALFAAIDVMAERLRALGVLAPASLSQLLHAATLVELGLVPGTEAVARLLAEDHEALSLQAQEAADLAAEHDDPATHDLLVTRMAVHDKAAWLLRSHVA